MTARVTAWSSALAPGDGDPRHGINGYCNLGCRCEICRAANTAYNQGMRLARKARIEADPTIRPHGVPATYRNYMCRCVPCTEASSAADAAAREARRNAGAA